MLHNYFLESGARAGKIRVYETTTHPVARRMIGYLLVRGGVHQLAYAVALEKATGVNIKAMLPVPGIPNSAFDETREFEAQGLHRTLLRFSPDDYRNMGQVFNGTHPEDGQPLEVKDGPPAGGPLADLPAIPSIGVPAFDMGELREMTARLLKNA